MISHVLEATLVCFVLDWVIYHAIPNYYRSILKKASKSI